MFIKLPGRTAERPVCPTRYRGGIARQKANYRRRRVVRPAASKRGNERWAVTRDRVSAHARAQKLEKGDWSPVNSGTWSSSSYVSQLTDPFAGATNPARRARNTTRTIPRLPQRPVAPRVTPTGRGMLYNALGAAAFESRQPNASCCNAFFNNATVGRAPPPSIFLFAREKKPA